MTNKELAEKFANEIHNMTGMMIDIDSRYDESIEMRVHYVVLADIDCEYAINAMSGNPPEYASFGNSNYRIVRAFNNVLREHEEDCIIAEYIHDLATEAKHNELYYIEFDADEMLINWYETAVQSAIDEANKIIYESLPKYLSNYSDSELYAELRRRGHYDVFEVCVSDLARYTDVCTWAGKARKIDSLMERWQENLIDCMDVGDELSDTLYEAAEELGYECEE